MPNWFNPSSEVKTPNELFGWNKPTGLLDGLVNIIVKGRSHVQILGERRAGKSSILNCLLHEIKKDLAKTKLIPVIVNFNRYMDTLDSGNGYNLFSACILNELGNIDELKPNNTIKISNVTINRANDVGGYLNNLSNAKLSNKQKTKRFFKNLIFAIAEKGYSVLLLIDEYEAMFMGLFEGKNGSLYGVRDLVMGELPNERYFQCCITGTRRWSDYHSDIGSDDFNFINETKFIPGLDIQKTKELILHGFDQSNKEIKNGDINKIFKLSGGWPFYIKSICNNYILHGGIDVTYLLEKLHSHFHSLWQRLDYEQQTLLKGKTSSQSSIDYLGNLNLLGTRKILFSNKIEPKGKLWKEFVSSQEIITKNTVENLNEYEENQRIAELKQVAQITNITVSDISDVLEGKELDVIFHLGLSPNYWKYAGRLFNPCYNKDTFSEFIVAIYILVFESTARHTITVNNKNNFPTFEKIVNTIEYPKLDTHIFKHWTEDVFIISYKCKIVDSLEAAIIKNCKGFRPNMTKHPMNMAALPPQFNRFPVPDDCPDIFHRIDVLRHKWAEAHDTRSENFEVKRFTPAQAQEKYLRHRRKPENIDWYTMQLGVLKDLNKVLASIFNWANE